jgi:hypothetical protein
VVDGGEDDEGAAEESYGEAILQVSGKIWAVSYFRQKRVQ